MEHQLADLHARPNPDRVHPARVAQLQRQAAVMEPRVDPAGQEVLEALTRPAGLEHKLSCHEVRDVEDLTGLRQAELPRLQQVRIFCGVAADAVDLQLRPIGHLDHQPIAQQHVDAGRVHQLGVEGHHHCVALAKLVDVVVRQRHRSRAVGLGCPSGLPPLERDHLQDPGDVRSMAVRARI